VLELRLVQSFVTVAECEHVGRAAAKLHISQSPLSRQIMQLEEQLGLPLFVREKRRIRLTDEGRWFLGEARELLERGARLERDARRAARGEVGTLVIGFVKSAMWHGRLPAALRRFGQRHPEVRLELRNRDSAWQVDALRRGELDLALVHSAPPAADLVSERVADEPYVLAVPRAHRLARLRPARLEPRDLDGAPWVTLARALYPEAYERFIAACALAGFAPDVRAEVADHATMLALVDAGLGLAIVPESARPGSKSASVFHRVPWLRARARIELVRRASGASSPALALAALLRPRRADPEDTRVRRARGRAGT
jgi:DNA-binding transcriptional LysR family regulator